MKNSLINWQEWSSNSLEKAKKDDKVILLYIRHESCYWCKQMEQDAWIDVKIANFVNKNLVPIYIDAHLHASLDKYTHKIFDTMTGQKSGYPLNIFLTHDLIPLYSTSYSPAYSKDGMMGIGQVSQSIVEKWQANKNLLIGKGVSMLESIEKDAKQKEATKVNSSLLDTASSQIKSLYDKHNGGFKGSPKFPRTQVLKLIIEIYKNNKDKELLEILAHSLESIANKSLRDTDNGFHRYCTDEAWRNPYKGKTIYTNSQIADIFLDAYEITGNKNYKTIALQTVEFILSNLCVKDKEHVGLLTLLYDKGTIQDSNIITSYNAIAITTLFKAAKHNSLYKQMAVSALAKLMEYGMKNGKIGHYIDPEGVKVIHGTLDDYANMSELLMQAHISTKEDHYLIKASEIINTALKDYFNSGFWKYNNKESFEVMADVADTEHSSSIAVISSVLEQASRLINHEYEKFLKRTIEVSSYQLMRQPISMPSLAEVAIKSIKHSTQV